MTQITQPDPFMEAAKVLWGQRPGSEVVPWEKLGEVGQKLLLDDAKAVVGAYERIRFLACVRTLKNGT